MPKIGSKFCFKVKRGKMEATVSEITIVISNLNLILQRYQPKQTDQFCPWQGSVFVT